jgi:hypothetical protein
VALDDTAAVRGKDPLTAVNIKALCEEIAHYCALGARVTDQACRRVLEGEQVPTSEKIYSIFEPHTDLIKRGKVRAPVEFGHKVFLAESAAGLITQYEVLKGNPVDEVHVAPSIRRHRRVFRRAPALYGADRGFFSESNIAVCARGGGAMVSIRSAAAERRLGLAPSSQGVWPRPDSGVAHSAPPLPPGGGIVVHRHNHGRRHLFGGRVDAVSRAVQASLPRPTVLTGSVPRINSHSAGDAE